jgi:hypothetical protein
LKSWRPPDSGPIMGGCRKTVSTGARGQRTRLRKA